MKVDRDPFLPVARSFNDYDGKVELDSELAVSYSQIREHRKPTEFTKQ